MKNTYLDILHQEHAGMVKLLKFLSADLETVRAGRQPDFSLIADILDYARCYPDVYHHPREDVLFQKFLKKDTCIQALIDAQIAEHEVLARLTQALCESVQGILSETLVQREQFAEQLSEYITRQKRHLMTEEESIFPVIDRVFTSEDWYEVEQTFAAVQDPLFGPQVSENYRNLYRRIMNNA